MYTRYFRMKDPKCSPEKIEWVEMTGKEFYRFVNSPEGQGRHFIDMGDVVLEGTQAQARTYRAEKDHSDYLKEQEENLIILSLYTLEDDIGCNGEEVILDELMDVESEAIININTNALRKALAWLDPESYLLIYDLYLADNRKTERSLADEFGLSQNAIHKRKKKILNRLKILVVKIQKSSQ